MSLDFMEEKSENDDEYGDELLKALESYQHRSLENYKENGPIVAAIQAKEGVGNYMAVLQCFLPIKPLGVHLLESEYPKERKFLKAFQSMFSYMGHPSKIEQKCL